MQNDTLQRPSRLPQICAGSTSRSGAGFAFMGKLQDLTGKTFSRLFVVGLAGRNNSGTHLWECLCQCGATTSATRGNLKNGHTKSCGCLRMDVSFQINLKHGHAHKGERTPTYRSWDAMKDRCLRQECEAFKHYGGRGIKICERWLHSFENFLADMGECPPGLTIDRKNNDGNYEPDNCRWADRKTQANNNRRNRIMEFNGERLTASQWADKLGIRSRTILERINNGWGIEKTLTTPI